MRCGVCRLDKPSTEFNQDRARAGYQRRCRLCQSAHSSTYDRRRHRGFRDQVFGYYGAVCVCCQEDRLPFLTIDHVNGDGALHRRSGDGKNLYRSIVRAGFPSWYRVLCFNCNLGRERNLGVCPHLVLASVEPVLDPLRY